MSQNEQILQYLESGNTITPLEAFTMCGTLALHSRIAELRGRGYRIDCSMKHEGGKHFGEYYLAIAHG